MSVKMKIERLERDFARQEKEKPLPLHTMSPVDESGMCEVVTLLPGKPPQERPLSEAEIAELT